MAARKDETPEQPAVEPQATLPLAPGSVGPIAAEPPPPNEPEGVHVAEPVVAEYVGPKDTSGGPLLFVSGVPAGSITESAWQGLSEYQREIVLDVAGPDGKPLYKMASKQQREREARAAQREAAAQVKRANG